MYAKFFGLRELPFNNTPDPRFFFATPDHEEAVAMLTYTVQERKGFVLLTGEVGVGKTLVSRMMLRHFGTRITFANIHHAVQDATDLMESLCTEFELQVEKGSSHSQYVHALHSFLLAQFAKSIPVVLIVDEAQGLPFEAFEQLRMIGNLEADDAKLLQVVILGQPELRHRFASPQLRQLRQRMFRCCHLPAMNPATAEDYIHHRLTLSGGPQLRPFDASALDAIHRHSQGLPRLINTICDNTMLCGYSSDRRRFDREFVETVISQMTSSEGYELRTATFPEADLQPTAAPQECTSATMPGSRPVAGMHPSRQQPYASESHEVIAVLARRVAELESRQMGIAASGTEPSLPRSSPSYAPLASGSRAGTTEAQQIRTLLGPAIKDARTVLGQIESGRRTVAQQEARVAGMARKAKAAFGEVRRVYENLKK
ncbi:MAG: AAA family ATPase, partial [Planctomycetes bacterium]|nr:AAA family ATPase [Planctomycetota bacterium]